jgi:hypothetical protein
VRDASENPFACLLQKIEAGQPDGAILRLYGAKLFCAGTPKIY